MTSYKQDIIPVTGKNKSVKLTSFDIRLLQHNDYSKIKYKKIVSTKLLKISASRQLTPIMYIRMYLVALYFSRRYTSSYYITRDKAENIGDERP